MDAEKIRPGIEVILTENGQALRDELGFISRFIVLEKNEKDDEDIRVRLKNRNAEEQPCFLMTDRGWIWIHSNPMTGKEAVSFRGPFYNIESALHPNWRLTLLEEERARKEKVALMEDSLIGSGEY